MIRVDWIRYLKKLLGELLRQAFQDLFFNFLNFSRTEFHIKFLWGCKGAFVSPEERHTKFEQVLGMMADKLANMPESFMSAHA